MILSMTGYGSVRLEQEDFALFVEVRTLNSKFFDLSLKAPHQLAAREADIRNVCASRLTRGKASVSIEISGTAITSPAVEYNGALFRNYYNQLKALADSVQAPETDLMRIAIQAPEVMVRMDDQGIDDIKWKIILEGLEEALARCVKFRGKEGESLISKLGSSVDAIEKHISGISELEPSRRENVRKRIRDHFQDYLGSEVKLDDNRFEQELIYYIEKQDITEELVRLESHVKYFRDVIDDDGPNGKKLGFISQEMGREINTIGSKANDSHIQKLVVLMKDDLEQIKEQLMNVV